MTALNLEMLLTWRVCPSQRLHLEMLLAVKGLMYLGLIAHKTFCDRVDLS
jgi:hypothetical protein